jgi:hypothetical protein
VTDEERARAQFVRHFWRQMAKADYEGRARTSGQNWGGKVRGPRLAPVKAKAGLMKGKPRGGA